MSCKDAPPTTSSAARTGLRQETDGRLEPSSRAGADVQNKANFDRRQSDVNHCLGKEIGGKGVDWADAKTKPIGRTGGAKAGDFGLDRGTRGNKLGARAARSARRPCGVKVEEGLPFVN
jgi:hypothetical protein